MNRLRLTVLALAVVASVASTLNPDPLPEVDSCDAADDAIVDTLALVHPDSDEPMRDREIHEVIYGSQGGAMVRLRLGVTGDDPPACMTTTFRYERCLDEDCVAVDADTGYPESISLRTYEDGSGRMTMEYFAILPYALNEGDLVRITVAVGPANQRVESSVLVWLGFEGSLPEATLDGGLGDGGSLDAGPLDAGPLDAGPLDAGI